MDAAAAAQSVQVAHVLSLALFFSSVRRRKSYPSCSAPSRGLEDLHRQTC